MDAVFAVITAAAQILAQEASGITGSINVVGYGLATLDRKLQAGELDVAFLTAPTITPAVCVEPLLDVDVAWLASPKLPAWCAPPCSWASPSPRLSP